MWCLQVSQMKRAKGDSEKGGGGVELDKARKLAIEGIV